MDKPPKPILTPENQNFDNIMTKWFPIDLFSLAWNSAHVRLIGLPVKIFPDFEYFRLFPEELQS